MRTMLALLALTTVAYAQPAPEDGQRKMRAHDFVVQQRNQAMDAVALCIGEYQQQLETLRKELDLAQKACPAAPASVPPPPK